MAILNSVIIRQQLQSKMRTSFKQLKIGSIFPKFKCFESARSLPYISYHLVITPGKSTILTLQQHEPSSILNQYIGNYNQKSYILRLTYRCNEPIKTQRKYFSEKLQNQQQLDIKDQPYLPKSLIQIMNTPIFIFLLIFSSTIRIPKIKLLKSAFKQLIDQLSLFCKWDKSSNYYKAIISYKGQQRYPKICYKDLFDIQQLGDKFENNFTSSENCKRNLQYLLNQLMQIKSKNTYRYCQEYFNTRLLHQLLEKDQNQIQQQYQHILDKIQQTYKSISCTHRIIIPQIIQNNFITQLNNTLGRTGSSCRTQRVRRTCSIIQVIPNVPIPTQKSDYSLKALKLYIRNKLVKQNKRTEGKESGVQVHSSKLIIDQQQKSVVQNLISELFINQYEQISKQLKGQTPLNMLPTQIQIYKKVIQKMGQYIQIDYKCLYLMEVIFSHILSAQNQDFAQQLPSKQQNVININGMMEQLQQALQSRSLLKEIEPKQLKFSQNNNELISGLCQHIQYLQGLLLNNKIYYNSLNMSSQSSIVSNYQKKKPYSPGDLTLNLKILSQKSNNMEMGQNNLIQSTKRQKYIQNKVQQLKRQQITKKNSMQVFKMSKNTSKQVLDKNKTSKQLNYSYTSERNSKKLILTNNDQIQNKQIQSNAIKSGRNNDRNAAKIQNKAKGWNSSTQSNKLSAKNQKSSRKEL